ncbi:hypothetical protein D5086_009994 [Populus alba]|uniref:Uncharacterized protein n=1 Tax=Populus alba TaxID=43335 RepID=A0ACC4C987_POPAL
MEPNCSLSDPCCEWISMNEPFMLQWAMPGLLLFEEPLHYCHKLWALQVAAQLGPSGKPLELTFQVNSLHPFASAPLLHYFDSQWDVHFRCSGLGRFVDELMMRNDSNSVEEYYTRPNG